MLSLLLPSRLAAIHCREVVAQCKLMLVCCSQQSPRHATVLAEEVQAGAVGGVVGLQVPWVLALLVGVLQLLLHLLLELLVLLLQLRGHALLLAILELQEASEI